MTTEEIYGRLDERLKGQDKTLDAILEQAKSTNGRVNKLEVWRGWITGGLAVLIFITGYVIKHIWG